MGRPPAAVLLDHRAARRPRCHHRRRRSLDVTSPVPAAAVNQGRPQTREAAQQRRDRRGRHERCQRRQGEGEEERIEGMRHSRSPVPLLLTLAGLTVTFAIGSAVILIWPQALLAGIVIACCGFVLSVVAVLRLTGRRWAPWLVGPAVALAGTGTIMLAEDTALSQGGDVTEAVVVDHGVEQKVVHNSRSRNRTVHTHTYSLEGTDGRPLEQPMVYRGEGGYDDIDIGDDITVLVDPQGRAETELEIGRASCRERRAGWGVRERARE